MTAQFVPTTERGREAAVRYIRGEVAKASRIITKPSAFAIAGEINFYTSTNVITQVTSLYIVHHEDDEEAAHEMRDYLFPHLGG